MTEEPDVVTLVQARTGTEAQVILALLEEAGIPAFIPGSHLTDEFAVSRQSLSGGAVEVQVPGSALEEARAVLERAREAAQASGLADADDAPDEAPDEGRS